MVRRQRLRLTLAVSFELILFLASDGRSELLCMFSGLSGLAVTCRPATAHRCWPWNHEASRRGSGSCQTKQVQSLCCQWRGNYDQTPFGRQRNQQPTSRSGNRPRESRAYAPGKTKDPRRSRIGCWARTTLYYHAYHDGQYVVFTRKRLSV